MGAPIRSDREARDVDGDQRGGEGGGHKVGDVTVGRGLVRDITEGGCR